MRHRMNLKSRRELLSVTAPRYQTANELPRRKRTGYRSEFSRRKRRGIRPNRNNVFAEHSEKNPASSHLEKDCLRTEISHSVHNYGNLMA